MAYPGYGAPPPGGYPGGYPGYQQPPMDPLYGYFQQVAGHDQEIDGQELQRCLTASGISGSYQPFNLETCRLMINMLDRDYSGKMGFNEFKELWGALNQWKTCFMQYDRDRSGTVEPHELHQALASFGYNLSPAALNVMVKRYSINNRISFDDFVACCVRLRALTDQFRRRDVSRTGNANFQYDDAEVVRSDKILSDHLTMSEIPLTRIYGLHTKSFIDLQCVFIMSKNDTKNFGNSHHQMKFPTAAAANKIPQEWLSSNNQPGKFEERNQEKTEYGAKMMKKLHRMTKYFGKYWTIIL